MDDQTFEKVHLLLNNSHNVAVIPSNLASQEAFAAAAGLYLSLKTFGKHPTFVYTAPVPEKFKTLINTQEIVTNVEYRELFVTVDYSDTPASKVNYEVEDDKLVFKVGPVHKNFDTSKVRAELKGYSFDAAFIVGARTQSELDSVFNELSLKNGQTQIVNIDNTVGNSRFGNLNIVDETKEALSTLVLELIARSKLPLSTQAAVALLNGITHRIA